MFLAAFYRGVCVRFHVTITSTLSVGTLLLSMPLMMTSCTSLSMSLFMSLDYECVVCEYLDDGLGVHVAAHLG